MERLTKHSKQTSYENGICCTHFLGFECLGVGGNCARNCKWEEAAWSRLAAYEDTGLEPEEINDLASVREISPETEYAINKHADNIIERLDKLLHQTDDDARLRELAEADRDGRLVVLPCQSGEHVFTLLDGQKRVRECEVKYAVLDGWLKVFYIEPIGAPGNLYSVPFGAFGQTVFLTREEAEKALEAMEDD